MRKVFNMAHHPTRLYRPSEFSPLLHSVVGADAIAKFEREFAGRPGFTTSQANYDDWNEARKQHVIFRRKNGSPVSTQLGCLLRTYIPGIRAYTLDGQDCSAMGGVNAGPDVEPISGERAWIGLAYFKDDEQSFNVIWYRAGNYPHEKAISDVLGRHCVEHHHGHCPIKADARALAPNKPRSFRLYENIFGTPVLQLGRQAALSLSISHEIPAKYFIYERRPGFKGKTLLHPFQPF